VWVASAPRRRPPRARRRDASTQTRLLARPRPSDSRPSRHVDGCGRWPLSRGQLHSSGFTGAATPDAELHMQPTRVNQPPKLPSVPAHWEHRRVNVAAVRWNGLHRPPPPNPTPPIPRGGKADHRPPSMEPPAENADIAIRRQQRPQRRLPPRARMTACGPRRVSQRIRCASARSQIPSRLYASAFLMRCSQEIVIFGVASHQLHREN